MPAVDANSWPRQITTANINPRMIKNVRICPHPERLLLGQDAAALDAKCLGNAECPILRTGICCFNKPYGHHPDVNQTWLANGPPNP